MVGLKNGHIGKNLTQNGEPQRYSWGTQKKKKKRTTESRKAKVEMNVKEEPRVEHLKLHKTRGTGIEPCCFLLSHTSDLETGVLVATLLCDLHCIIGSVQRLVDPMSVCCG